jgi:hypothetical protein
MEIRLEKIAGGIAEPTYIFDECDLGGVSIGLADIRTKIVYAVILRLYILVV